MIKEVKHLLWIDSNDLLDEYRCLPDKYVDELDASSAIDQDYWLAEMESAISAAQYSQQRKVAKMVASHLVSNHNQRHPLKVRLAFMSVAARRSKDDHVFVLNDLFRQVMVMHVGPPLFGMLRSSPYTHTQCNDV